MAGCAGLLLALITVVVSGAGIVGGAALASGDAVWLLSRLGRANKIASKPATLNRRMRITIFGRIFRKSDFVGNVFSTWEKARTGIACLGLTVSSRRRLKIGQTQPRQLRLLHLGYSAGDSDGAGDQSRNAVGAGAGAGKIRGGYLVRCQSCLA